MQIVAPPVFQGSVPLPIHLMAEDGSLIPPNHTGASPLSTGRGVHTVLIADDSQTERTYLGRILQDAGYEVLVASSGNEAKALAEKHQPDVIFLDIIMEDGDGYQACRHLRRNPLTANIPIIMVSSKANPVDIQWATKLGATSYVIKPYTAQVILDHLLTLAG